MHAAILLDRSNSAPAAAPPVTETEKERLLHVTTEPRAAPHPAPPRWAVKPVRQLTAGELAEALAYLERHRPDDDVLGRALAGEFARRTAAAEFARRAADRVPPREAARSAPDAGESPRA
jgi:hypothetical protein